MNTDFDKLKPSDLFQDDPIWLFEQDLFNTRKQKKFKIRSGPWIKVVLALIACIGFSIGVGVFLSVSSSGENSVMPFYLVELRVVDASGRPLTGASIELSEGINGVTDSFGEWRHFLRLSPESTLKVRLSKGNGKRRIFEEREVVVPAPSKRNKDLTLPISISLSKNDPKRTAKPAYEGSDKDLDGGAKKIAADGVKQTSAFAPPQEPEEGPFTSYNLVVAAPPTASLQTSQLKQHQTLQHEIATELRHSLAQMGLKFQPDSPFQIKLALLPTKDGQSLIQTDLRWQSASLSGSEAFIREFSEQNSQTVQRLLNLIRIHVPVTYHIYQEAGLWYVVQPNTIARFWRLDEGRMLYDRNGRSYILAREELAGGGERMRIGLLRNESLCEGIAVSACSLQTANLQSVPPVAGWQPLKIKFREAFPAGVRVFASGFRARQIEPQTWQYWGAPGGQHNITVVHGQRIVLRARIKDTVGSTTLYPSVLESRVLTPKSNRKRNNF